MEKTFKNTTTMKYNLQEDFIPVYTLPETSSKIDYVIDELECVDGLNSELYFLQLILNHNEDKGVYQLVVENSFDRMRFVDADGKRLTYEDVGQLDDNAHVYEVNEHAVWSGEELKFKFMNEIAMIQDWAKEIANKYNFLS